MKDFSIENNGVRIAKETTTRGVEKFNLEVPNIFTVKEGRSKLTGGITVKSKESGRTLTVAVEVKLCASGNEFITSGRLSDFLEKKGVTIKDIEDLVKIIGAEMVLGTIDGKDEALNRFCPLIENLKTTFSEEN